MSIMPFRYTATEVRTVILWGLLLSIAVGTPACSQRERTEYETFRALIPPNVRLDTSKHIALLLYNPQGCMPCNYILTNLFGNPDYTTLFGHNSFVVFPSVRPSELQDYDRLFKTYGNVSVQLINDRRLYEQLQRKKRDVLKGKPKWVGLNTRSKACFCFNLREVYMWDSISRYFKE